MYREEGGVTGLGLIPKKYHYFYSSQSDDTYCLTDILGKEEEKSPYTTNHDTTLKVSFFCEGTQFPRLREPFTCL